MDILRFDPHLSTFFAVEIDGILTASFTEVSGLSWETGVEDYEEGGQNKFTYQLPGRTKYDNLVLKRGLSDHEVFWSWCSKSLDGKIVRKDGTIFLLDNKNGSWPLRIVMWWDFFDAFPVKWEGPELSAMGSEVAIETIELAHHGLSKPVSSYMFSNERLMENAVQGMM